MPSVDLPLALLPDFGGGEMMMILFVVLLLFGGEKMPQLAKGIGKALREFKKATSDVEQEIKRALDDVPDMHVPDLAGQVRKVVSEITAAAGPTPTQPKPLSSAAGSTPAVAPEAPAAPTPPNLASLPSPPSSSPRPTPPDSSSPPSPASAP